MTVTTAGSFTGGDAGERDDREARLLRILGHAGRIRTMGGEQWLFAAGAGLVVAGLLCIVVGWVGTSRTVLVAGQIPYLVSGGLLGLGLVFIGGFLYFGHWVSVMARESRESAAADRRDLEVLRLAIAELAAAIRDAPAPAVSDARRAERGSTPALVATANGSMMHRRTCAAVAGRDVRSITPSDGLRACGICRPLDEHLTT